MSPLQPARPSKVNEISNAVIELLQGQGGALQQLLSSTSSFTTDLAARDQLIGDVVNNLNTVLGTVDEKNAEFDDPETTRLYLAVDESADWDPHDPRLDQLIDDLDTWQIRHHRPTTRSTELVASRISESTPAWQRIVNALTHRAQQRATEHGR